MAMNYITFNQDYSHLAVGTSRGFRLFTTDPFAKCYETREGNIALLEMLFSTSLVAVILSPRRLQIKNTKRDSIICELTFPTTVLAVRLNRKRLVIVLEDQIYLYDVQTMKLLYTIETSPNPAAICALSPSSDNCYLVYPLPQKVSTSTFSQPSHVPPPSSTHVAPTTGEVLIFDAEKLEAINVVEAHRSPLSCVVLNNEGTIMASASDKGTIIRVFSVPDAHKLYQFRRGSMPSRIFSMAFNITSSLLCVSSATETIHVFKLSPHAATASPEEPSSPIRGSNPFTRRLSTPSNAVAQEDDDDVDMEGPKSLSNRKSNGTFMGLIRRTSQNVGTSLASTMGGYLPKGMAEMWEPSRDFAWIRLPRTASGTSPAQIRSVVAMSSNSPQVMVVTNEGNFYVFSIDLSKGGEGVLTKQYSVLDLQDGSRGSGMEE